MLIKYKNDYEKIAMGLLSFIPDLKDVTRINLAIKGYQDTENRDLYLWKNEAGNFTGIVGIENDGNVVVVRAISLSPDERHKKVSFLILSAVLSLYPDKKIMGTIDTTKLIEKWEMQKNESKI
ncbi:N-acetyltransferase [Dellaglioa sp. P0083]|uniref:N-acetyltransferase n=1 Tax=Dellaglioa kimchii TaxID=3344667 RepID=UPI0038D450CE